MIMITVVSRGDVLYNLSINALQCVLEHSPPHQTVKRH